MKDYQLLSSIRRKENKTDEDKLLLHYHDMLAIICECLVDESKCHISRDETVTEIIKVMNGINVSLENL